MFSGIGNLDNLCCIDISASTSRRLYALNRSHLSMSCSGRLRTRPPFDLVGGQGVQKYLIRSLPSVNFCFSKPKTAPTPSSESGSPIYADQIMEHFQDVGLRYPVRLSHFDRHTRSNIALKAHLVTEL